MTEEPSSDALRLNVGLEAAFIAGRNTGLSWNDEYEPGGPWGCTCPKCLKETIAMQAEWKRGFRDGIASNLSLSDKTPG
jgi:hypothetical protein